jgi:hypothetical protein
MFPSAPRSSCFLLSSYFLTRTVYAFVFLLICATRMCPSNLTLLHLIVVILSAENYKLWTSPKNFFQTHLISPLLSPNISPTPSPLTLSVNVTPLIWDQVSYRHKTADKITVYTYFRSMYKQFFSIHYCFITKFLQMWDHIILYPLSNIMEL